MERHSEAGTVGAGGKYKAVNIPSELHFERTIVSVVCAGFYRYMDIISDFSCVKIAFGFAKMPGFHKVKVSYANGWYNELVGAFRPVSREKAPLSLICAKYALQLRLKRI